MTPVLRACLLIPFLVEWLNVDESDVGVGVIFVSGRPDVVVAKYRVRVGTRSSKPGMLIGCAIRYQVQKEAHVQVTPSDYLQSSLVPARAGRRDRCHCCLRRRVEDSIFVPEGFVVLYIKSCVFFYFDFDEQRFQPGMDSSR